MRCCLFSLLARQERLFLRNPSTVRANDRQASTVDDSPQCLTHRRHPSRQHSNHEKVTAATAEEISNAGLQSVSSPLLGSSLSMWTSASLIGSSGRNRHRGLLKTSMPQTTQMTVAVIVAAAVAAVAAASTAGAEDRHAQSVTMFDCVRVPLATKGTGAMAKLMLLPVVLVPKVYTDTHSQIHAYAYIHWS